MKKALIKDTGELLDIRQTYQVVKMNFTFDLKGKIESGNEKDFKYEPNYYILSDDKEYHEDDVIVGVDNIRDWKIKNII